MSVLSRGEAGKGEKVASSVRREILDCGRKIEACTQKAGVLHHPYMATTAEVTGSMMGICYSRGRLEI